MASASKSATCRPVYDSALSSACVRTPYFDRSARQRLDHSENQGVQLRHALLVHADDGFVSDELRDVLTRQGRVWHEDNLARRGWM
jgi:hypothetical protein